MMGVIRSVGTGHFISLEMVLSTSCFLHSIQGLGYRNDGDDEGSFQRSCRHVGSQCLMGFCNGS